MRASLPFIGRLVALLSVGLTVSASAMDYWVYFGTYTGPASQGIYVSRLDGDTGRLSAPELAAETISPSYLAIAPGERFLYAANSTRKGDKYGGVSAFAIDHHTGRLTFLNEKSSAGSDPCHVSVDATGRTVFLANYNTGSLKSFPLNPDGTLGADGSFIEHHGSSVNPQRQTAAHAHFIAPDPSNRYALACDLGMDEVLVYQLDLAAGTLTRHAFTFMAPGSGPRHIAFSADGKFAHVINEMACTITTCAWDADAGRLTVLGTVSALPPGVAVRPNFTGAEIRPVGDHIYATVRGHDSVSVFSADPKTGRLTFLQNVPAGGKMPRGLGIDPGGRWLFVGNQTTGNVVEYAIDSHSGKLTPTGTELKMGSPVDVEFVKAE